MRYLICLIALFTSVVWRRVSLATGNTTCQVTTKSWACEMISESLQNIRYTWETPTMQIKLNALELQGLVSDLNGREAMGGRLEKGCFWAGSLWVLPVFWCLRLISQANSQARSAYRARRQIPRGDRVRIFTDVRNVTVQY